MIPVLEIGGTHVTAALVDGRPERLVAGSRRRDPIDAAGSAETILDAIVACARSLGAQPGSTWGVAIPGPFDYGAGIGRFERVAKFEALNGVDVRRNLVASLEGDMQFLNDADAFVLGEWAVGAAAGHERVAGITLGTGIGSGFVADGRIIDDGGDVPPEGRVDLLTIAGRPLEETVSRRAILAAYRDHPNRPDDAGELDVHDVAERARAGDVAARAVLETAIGALGHALAPWIARFRASVLVVGGSMAGSWDLVGPPLRTALAATVAHDSRGGPLAVVRALHPEDAALIGAARCASDRMGDPRTRHTGSGR